MKILHYLLSALLLGFVLAACEPNETATDTGAGTETPATTTDTVGSEAEGAAEEAGEAADEAAQDAGQALDNAADETQDAAEDAADEVEDATDDTNTTN